MKQPERAAPPPPPPPQLYGTPVNKQNVTVTAKTLTLQEQIANRQNKSAEKENVPKATESKELGRDDFPKIKKQFDNVKTNNLEKVLSTRVENNRPKLSARSQGVKPPAIKDKPVATSSTAPKKIELEKKKFLESYKNLERRMKTIKSDVDNSDSMVNKTLEQLTQLSSTCNKAISDTKKELERLGHRHEALNYEIQTHDLLAKIITQIPTLEKKQPLKDRKWSEAEQKYWVDVKLPLQLNADREKNESGYSTKALMEDVIKLMEKDEINFSQALEILKSLQTVEVSVDNLYILMENNQIKAQAASEIIKNITIPLSELFTIMKHEKKTSQEAIDIIKAIKTQGFSMHVITLIMELDKVDSTTAAQTIQAISEQDISIDEIAVIMEHDKVNSITAVKTIQAINAQVAAAQAEFGVKVDTSVVTSQTIAIMALDKIDSEDAVKIIKFFIKHKCSIDNILTVMKNDKMDAKNVYINIGNLWGQNKFTIDEIINLMKTSSNNLSSSFAISILKIKSAKAKDEQEEAKQEEQIKNLNEQQKNIRAGIQSPDFSKLVFSALYTILIDFEARLGFIINNNENAYFNRITPYYKKQIKEAGVVMVDWIESAISFRDSGEVANLFKGLQESLNISLPYIEQYNAICLEGERLIGIIKAQALLAKANKPATVNITPVKNSEASDGGIKSEPKSPSISLSLHNKEIKAKDEALKAALMANSTVAPDPDIGSPKISRKLYDEMIANKDEALKAAHDLVNSNLLAKTEKATDLFAPIGSDASHVIHYASNTLRDIAKNCVYGAVICACGYLAYEYGPPYIFRFLDAVGSGPTTIIAIIGLKKAYNYMQSSPKTHVEKLEAELITSSASNNKSI